VHINKDGQDPADSIAASYTVDMADEVDTLHDLVKERLARLKIQNPAMNLDELAKATAQIIEDTLKTEADSPLIKNKRDDTLDESLLALATNRSPHSLTAIARKFINPSTGKNYTRAALSARLSELSKRTGLVLRVQRSERVRKIYKERALRVHERRRREVPKWNREAWEKGLKKKEKKR
jgi:gentisate 1,2-dioxygenase